MKLDSVVYTVAGMAFGVILGWVIGSQQLGRAGTAPVAQPPIAQSAPATGGGTAAGGRAAPVLDQARVDQLNETIKGNPKDVSSVVQLANVYFDAERWPDAISWYERALSLNPNDADVSTDLGVSYYYTNRTEDALNRFERSLEINPKHTKTLLNKGIVLAFGKEDLKGAAEEWRKVVELAPGSPEGEAARRALEGVAAAHADQAPPSQQ
jgi:Flp pilus assembly protein TadD